MTAAVYIRTSTDDQDGEAQRVAVTKAAPAGATVYTDRGISGAKVSRPALDQLRADVRAGTVREVYTFALDRLGRSAVAVIGLLDEWGAAGVRVVSLREGALDPATPVGAMVIAIFAALAQMERAIIRERVRAGVERTRDPATGKLTRTKSGRPFGRQPRADVDGREVLRRRAAGESWRRIAQALKAPQATIRRIAARTVPETPTRKSTARPGVSRTERRRR